MIRVAVSDARKRLSELVGRAGEGEEIVLIRRGQDVARLVAASPPDARPLVPSEAAVRAVADLRAARRGLRLGDVELKELIETGC